MTAVSFGPFRFDPERRQLLDGAKTVQLGSRAMDILVLLVERRGQLVSKEDLISRVWPNTFVDEANLRVHVWALRRALGDGQAGHRYIVNAPGRGYRFVSPVSSEEIAAPLQQHTATHPPPHHVPIRLTRIFGRTALEDAISIQLPDRRFVTIVGPGGVGKTTLAVAIADRLNASYRDGIYYIDLSLLADPALVPMTVAAVLGIEVRSERLMLALLGLLRDKQMLLVIDNCEHLVAAAAELATNILKGAPGVNILCTSREPLRAEGERVYRLRPLVFPPTWNGVTAAEALAFPAVQLFVDSAAASLDTFVLTDENAPAVAEICSRLDGIPLAIEMAAARIDSYGAKALAELLVSRFTLLTRGTRTALPRHQTLAATLDWSYNTLSETERAVLRRLSVFAGRFTLESAAAVVTDAFISGPLSLELTANLVAKSLVTVDVGGADVSYRLLETTRAYALEKLETAGELTALARRHADYFRETLERAEADFLSRSNVDRLATYGGQIDNVRMALDWAFSVDGDKTIAVALTLASVPLWFKLSLMEECRQRVKQAIETADSQPNFDERRKMQLWAAMGSALLYTKGPGPDIESAWTQTLRIAETFSDNDYQLRALWGLLTNLLNNFKIRKGLSLAQQFCDVAAQSTNPNDVLVGRRLVGGTLFFLGNQTAARRHIEDMLDGYSTTGDHSDLIRFQFDQPVRARSTLAEILWLQGFPEQATRMASDNVDYALSTKHAHTVCNSLAQGACPVFLSICDLEKAEHFNALLMDQAVRHGLSRWQAWARCFDSVLAIRRGRVAAGLQGFRETLDELPKAVFALRYVAFRGEQASALGLAGHLASGLAVIDDALSHSEDTEERWWYAELLRIKGELTKRLGLADSVKLSESYFEKSLLWSSRQQAKSLELRGATSLAQLYCDQGRHDAARNLLAPVYSQFDHKYETADLAAAKSLLAYMAFET